MSLRLTASVVCVLLSPPLFAQEAEDRKSPINIRSITLHEEGKEARSVDVESEPRDFVPASTGQLDGNWAIAEDTGGGLSVRNQPLTIRTTDDGSIIAEFSSEMSCPDSSGVRTQYIAGDIEGGTIVGTMNRCTGKAYVDQCGDAGVYTIDFRADVRNTDTIVGRYTATGYRIAANGCVEDSAYDADHTFELRRRETAVRAAAVARRELPPSQCGSASPRPDRNATGDTGMSDNGWTYHPVDLNAYCEAEHGDSAVAVVEDEQDAYSWRCQIGGAGGTSWHEVSVAGACGLQSPWAEPHLANSCDAYSWSCAMPPGTQVYVRLDRILSKEWAQAFLIENDPELTFTITVDHRSIRCGEYAASVCENWVHEVSHTGYIEDNFIDIDLTHSFRVYEGSNLFIDVKGLETDPFFDDWCDGGYNFWPEGGDWTFKEGRADCAGTGYFEHTYNALMWEIFTRD